jgi:hypothetical protein
MAFIVEDGTGRADANSFISVEDADAYHALRGNSAWAGLTLEKKQANLVVAFDYMEGVYGMAYPGRRVYAQQGSSFPRVGMSAYGFPVKPNEIPQTVKKVQAELAFIANSQPLTANAKRGKKRVKVGPIDVEYDGSAPMQTVFVAAARMMAPLLGGFANGVNVKLVRC